MSYNPQNPNGQATAANSSPVVIASDQSGISIDLAKTAGTTTSINNGISDAGTQRVTLSSDSTGQVIARGNVASGATDAGNPVKVGGVYNSAAPTLTTGQRGDLQLDASGNLKVASGATQTVTGTVGLATGTNSVGTVGLNSGTNAIGTINLSPTTSGGWSVSSQTALTATATVSGAAGKFGGYMFVNTNNSVAYIQVFDTAGAVTLGSTTPTFVVPIPAGGAANVEFTNGIAIASGIKIAATTTATGSTTVATALTGFVMYK